MGVFVYLFGRRVHRWCFGRREIKHMGFRWSCILWLCLGGAVLLIDDYAVLRSFRRYCDNEDRDISDLPGELDDETSYRKSLGLFFLS